MAKQEHSSAFEIKDLFDASVHYGHKTQFWNPKMKPYICGESEGIYIIDLIKTYHNLNRALSEL